MSNFYVSPEPSEGGPEGSPQSVKPELNVNLMNKKARRQHEFPEGIFTDNMRAPLKSRVWGNVPFFKNAKPAAMRERGWVRSTAILKPTDTGLYTVKDGPEIRVTVMSVIKLGTILSGNRNVQYTFKDMDGNIAIVREKDRYEEWDFYTATDPIPFVPRKGGTRKHKKRKTRRKA